MIGCVAGIALAGCDTSGKEAPAAPRERSQAVIAQPGSTPKPAAIPTAKPSASHKPVKARKLCDGHLVNTGHTLQKGGISRRQARGQPELPESLELEPGITWVNFWAAWCAPCKEEIPRLLDWQKRLRTQGKAFHVVFVSLDDDPRQLQNYLDQQKPDGLRATYWLKDGEERVSWLKAVGMQDDPELPAHVLVDARGDVRCTVDGAIEDGDFPSLEALVP